MDMTLFGNKIFANQQVTRRSLGWAPNQYACLSKKGEFGNRVRHREGQCHVRMKTKIMVMHLQANEHWRLPVNHQKPKEKPGTDCPSQLSGGTHPIHTTTSEVQPPVLIQ